MKKMNQKIILFTFSLFCFCGCIEKKHEFDINLIDTGNYPVLTDSLTVRELVFNNPIVSNWQYVEDRRYMGRRNDTSTVYEWYKNTFDSFFWKSFEQDYNKVPIVPDTTEYLGGHGFFPIYGTLIYQIIDTIQINNGYGILIFNEIRSNLPGYSKQLFLPVFDENNKNIATYTVGQDFFTGAESIVTTTSIYSNNRLITKTENQFSSKDSLVYHTYDLNRHLLIKSDTVYYR